MGYHKFTAGCLVPKTILAQQLISLSSIPYLASSISRSGGKTISQSGSQDDLTQAEFDAMVEDLNTEFEEKFSREDLADCCSTEELDQLFQPPVKTTNPE